MYYHKTGVVSSFDICFCFWTCMWCVETVRNKRSFVWHWSIISREVAVTEWAVEGQ